MTAKIAKRELKNALELEFNSNYWATKITDLIEKFIDAKLKELK